MSSFAKLPLFYAAYENSPELVSQYLLFGVCLKIIFLFLVGTKNVKVGVSVTF